jgi:hypothetical protein
MEFKENTSKNLLIDMDIGHKESNIRDMVYISTSTT